MQMKLNCLMTAFLMLTLLSMRDLAGQTGKGKSPEYPTPSIREEQVVVVGEVAEVWKLKWTSPPKPVCEPRQDSLTCPCNGFAFGEEGHLTLVRMRRGEEIERLDLSPFFAADIVDAEGLAVVQRWEPDYDKDYNSSTGQDFPAVVAKRRIAQVMHFAEFEPGGWQSEFYLQTEAGPCGHTSGVVIGVSKTNPRLHAVGTTEAPGRPLHLQEREWEALRHASGPIEVLDWPCGDHGADTETRLWLRWTSRGVDGTQREYSCDDNFKPGKLLSEKPL